MNKILVLKDVAYGSGCATINNINSLATGSVCIFAGDDNAKIPTPMTGLGTDLAGKKKVFFAVGDTVNTTKSKLSQMIDRATLKVVKKAYVAPVGETHFIGDDGTASADVLNTWLPTLVAGDEIGIILVSSIGKAAGLGSIYNDKVKRYDTVVRNGDTIPTLIQRLVDTINADADRFANATMITATTACDGIRLVNVDVTDTLEVKTNGLLSGVDVDVATGVVVKVEGQGTAAQIAALEQEFSSLEGNTNQIIQPDLWFKYGFQAVPGETYDMYVLTWDGKADLGQSQGVKTFTEQKLILAVPTSYVNLVNVDFTAQVNMCKDLVNSPL